MLIFRGRSEQRIDDKGRVAIPQKWRDVLRGSGDERLFITNSRSGDAPCLDAYPTEAWESLEQKLLRESHTMSGPIRRFYLNYYIPNVQECVIDKQGRVLLPEHLRVHARLEKNVVLAGVLNMFRIWNPSAEQPVREASEKVLVDNPDVTPGFGLGEVG